jgi:hypothetical protein
VDVPETQFNKASQLHSMCPKPMLLHFDFFSVALLPHLPYSIRVNISFKKGIQCNLRNFKTTVLQSDIHYFKHKGL